MEAASLPFKQPDHLATVQTAGSNQIAEKLINGSKTKANTPTRAMFSGKTKGKKKIEDIITNLKKVKQVANISTNVTSASEPQEDDESFASMCTIRTDTPDYRNVTELPPLKKQNPEQSNAVKHDHKTSPLPEKVVQSAKIIQTTSPISNPPTPVRQVILQTVPQKNLPNQQTPIILNKLPPGFIIRNDLPSGSFANLQNTSTSGQPKLLLITKAGGPFFLAQNVNASTIHTQAKPVNKLNVNSPVQTKLPASQKGRPPNSNILGSPSKTNTEKPLITVQYNLPYPNNNCKVVNKPITAQKIQNSASLTFQALGNVIKPSRPREMVVNFAGNQTAHITTMSEETSVVPEKKTQFIPSFVYCSPPATSNVRNKSTTPAREKPKEKTFGVATSSATVSNANAGKNRNNTGPFRVPQKRFTYDEKIAKLTGKVTNIYQSGGKAKTSSHGLKRKSTVEPNVRVSSRKRQQTEKAKLFEKSKKRKKNDDNITSPRQQKTEKMKLNIKVEREDETYTTSAKAVSPGQTMNKSLSKKTNTVPRQQSAENETNSKKEQEDTGSLFRDPALLTREERALQRALMMFKELEEKQARKKPKDDADDDTSIHKDGTINQLNKTDDVQRKRKISNEGNDESLMKKRKRGLEKQPVEKKTDEKSGKHGERVQKNSEIVGKMMKEKMHLPIEKTPVHLSESGKREDSLKVVPKKAESTSETVKNTPTNPAKENKQLKTVKDVSNTPKSLKSSPKTPESTGEKHRVKTYMLVPSYHGFKDFSPVVLGSRTRSKKAEPVKTEEEDEVPVTKTPEKSEKDIALLVIETVGNKAVKQDVVAKDEEMRDFVKNSLRAQGMLKQDLERTEKDEDADLFENREKRHLTVNRNTGETVLHKASRMGYDETVYHCIQQGSDSNAKDNAGWTPLHEASSRGHADVVRVLAKYNADVNACSNDGIRPIHDAADNGNIDSLRLLMAYGADPFISTYSGRSVVDCAKRTEAKDYIKACIGDLYLNDERNNIASVNYENRWEFRGSSSILEEDCKYLGDVFDNLPKQQSNNKSAEFEWSETPHLPTYSLPLVKDGVVVGRKNYITLNDLQEALNKPRQNVVRLLKRTKIREMSRTEFSKEVSSSFFHKRSECLAGSANAEEEMVELVPLNWTVRSLLKIKCEQLAL